MIQAKQIAGITTYLFKPGLPSSGARFGTWSELEAAGMAAEMPVLVQVDDALAPAVMPGRPAPWIGAIAGSIRSPNPVTGVTTLQVQEGALLPNLSVLTDGLLFDAQATATSPILLTDKQVLIVQRGAHVITTGTRPAILATPGNSPGGGPTIALFSGSQIGADVGGNDDVGVFPLPLATNGLTIILLDAIGAVQPGSIFGPGSATTLYTANSQLAFTNALPPLQPGLAMLQVLDVAAPFLQTYYVETLAAGMTSYLGPGNAASSYARPQAGFLSVYSNLVTILLLVASAPAAPNPPGSQVQFDVLVGGVPIPGATVVLDANTGLPVGSNFVQFLAALSSGAFVSLRATEIGGPLASGLQDVIATLI